MAVDSYLYQAFTWVVDGILYVIKGGAFFIFDGLLTCLEAILKSVKVADFIASSASAWAGLPPQMVYCLDQIHLGAGLVLVGSAIAVRVTLNLIPAAFTRV